MLSIMMANIPSKYPKESISLSRLQLTLKVALVAILGVSNSAVGEAEAGAKIHTRPTIVIELDAFHLVHAQLVRLEADMRAICERVVCGPARVVFI